LPKPSRSCVWEAWLPMCNTRLFLSRQAVALGAFALDVGSMRLPSSRRLAGAYRTFTMARRWKGDDRANAGSRMADDEAITTAGRGPADKPDKSKTDVLAVPVTCGG